jgi:hypothetical protein
MTERNPGFASRRRGLGFTAIFAGVARRLSKSPHAERFVLKGALLAISPPDRWPASDAIRLDLDATDLPLLRYLNRSASVLATQ